MRRLCAVFVILNLILSFSISARQSNGLYVQFSKLHNDLLKQLTDHTAVTPALEHISFNYIQGQGGQFYLSFEQPLQQWQAQIRAQQLNLTDKDTIELAQANPVKQQFDQTRSMLKALSHQSYSLERQLQSMKKSQAELSGQAWQDMQQHINDATTQLKQQQEQKEQLKPRYEQLQQQLSRSNTIINPQDFFEHIRRQISTQLCSHPQLASLLPATESIAFVLQQTGNFKENHYQNTIYNVAMKDIHSCINREINSDQLLGLVAEQHF